MAGTHFGRILVERVVEEVEEDPVAVVVQRDVHWTVRPVREEAAEGGRERQQVGDTSAGVHLVGRGVYLVEHFLLHGEAYQFPDSYPDDFVLDLL